jgi:hypothetical protein
MSKSGGELENMVLRSGLLDSQVVRQKHKQGLDSSIPEDAFPAMLLHNPRGLIADEIRWGEQAFVPSVMQTLPLPPFAECAKDGAPTKFVAPARSKACATLRTFL